MRLFKKKFTIPPVQTVATITASLHDTVAELESHADSQLVKAAAMKAMAESAEAAHDAHKAEHAVAVQVADNIKSLLSV